MKVEKKSELTGKINVMEIDITREELQNEATTDQIQFAIRYYATEIKLEPMITENF